MASYIRWSLYKHLHFLVILFFFILWKYLKNNLLRNRDGTTAAWFDIPWSSMCNLTRMKNKLCFRRNKNGFLFPLYNLSVPISPFHEHCYKIQTLSLPHHLRSNIHFWLDLLVDFPHCFSDITSKDIPVHEWHIFLL